MGSFGWRAGRTHRDRAPETEKPIGGEWVAVDVETATPNRDSLCSIAAVRVVDGKVADSFSELVRPPKNTYGARNTMVHGLSSIDTATSRSFDSVAYDFWHYVGSRPLIAHNAAFDSNVIERSQQTAGFTMSTSPRWFCTLRLAEAVWPNEPSHKLSALCGSLGIELDHHRAASDALACALIGIELLKAGGVREFSMLRSNNRRGGNSRRGETGLDPELGFRPKPRVAPESWTEEDLAQAQAIVDLWLSGKKLREIDESMGRKSGSASATLTRLRRNGLAVPSSAQRRDRSMSGANRETFEVRLEHMGPRRALASDTPPDAQIVVFTGEVPSSSRCPSRTELETMAEKAGWIVRGTVTKKTSVLVVCEPSFSSGKTAKAKQLGTRCISPEEFMNEHEKR